MIELLDAVDAPPRLVAHLRLVHDVASRLCDELAHTFPRASFERDAILFGAATHDIGKAIHRAELVGPGSLHEVEGERLLLERSIPSERARFARTHARWMDDEAALEDLVVALADKVWKGRREDDLERRIVERLAASTGEARWKVFEGLDRIAEMLARDADDRLAFQASFAV